MNVESRPLAGVIVLEPHVFEDSRGFFFEGFNLRELERVGVARRFVQDNFSRSRRNVVRGLHYQIGRPQAKLVRVVRGEVLDVIVDLRRSSPTFGAWTSVVLSEANRRAVFVPEGCAHGLVARADVVDVLYKASDYYSPAHERCIAWNDEDLGIDWRLEGAPILSERDAAGGAFRDAEVFT